MEYLLFFFAFIHSQSRKGGALVNVISLQPQVLDLLLYAGDGASMRLVCVDEDDAPVDITGAVRAHVRVDRLSDDAPIVEFSVNTTDAYLGIVVISLTGDQTQELSDHTSSKAGKFTGVWDLEWDPSEAEPRTMCQGKLECVADVTR